MELYCYIYVQNGGDRVAGFGFDDVTHLRRLKPICKPNFNDISKYTAYSKEPIGGL